MEIREATLVENGRGYLQHLPAGQGSDGKLKARIRKVGDKGGHLRGEWHMIHADHQKLSPAFQAFEEELERKIRSIEKYGRPPSWKAVDEMYRP